LRILISGASGFLGKYITAAFSFLNLYVDTIGRSKENSIIADFEKIIPIPNSYDLVIHAAGKAHSIPKTDKDRSSYFKINVIGTSNFLDGLSKSIPKQFVFISSVSVYGLIEGENINETSSLLAKDPYGKSKIEAEEIVNKWCKENNVICTILRLPLVVGLNPPGNLGAMIFGIKKGYYFNVAGGNAKKSMVLASDIPKFILKAAEVGGIYNLTDGTHPTFNELSKKISFKLGKSIVLNLPLFAAKILAKFGDIIGDTFPINSNKLSKITSTLTFDDSKARMSFGWEPTPVLDALKLHEDD
jgi:nucleoside-diphosphate-sugar epimerase